MLPISRSTCTWHGEHAYYTLMSAALKRSTVSLVFTNRWTGQEMYQPTVTLALNTPVHTYMHAPCFLSIRAAFAHWGCVCFLSFKQTKTRCHNGKFRWALCIICYLLQRMSGCNGACMTSMAEPVIVYFLPNWPQTLCGSPSVCKHDSP